MGEQVAVIGRSLRWTWGLNTVAAILQLALACLTARFVAPADYGLMAAAAGTVRFALYLADLGISSAIIQKPDFDTAHDGPVFFWTSAAAGAVTASLIWLLAPWLAGWSGHPEAVWLIRAYGLIAVLSGAGQTGLALARRRLDFRAIGLWGLSAMLVGQGLVATPLAVAGFGAWSLLAGALTQAAILALLALRSSAGILRIVPLTRIRGIELARLSSRFLTLRILDSAGLHLLPVAVFLLCGAYGAGLWDRAFALTVVPLEMVAAGLGQILFPLFSRLGDDPAARREVWLSSLMLMVTMTAAIAAGMAAAATALVPLALGEDWSATAAPFFWLAVWSAIRSVTQVSGSLLEGAGRLTVRAAIQSAYLLAIGAALLLVSPARAEDVALCLVAVELAAAMLLLPAAARTCGAAPGAVAVRLASALLPTPVVAAAAGAGVALGGSPASGTVLAIGLSILALLGTLLYHPYRPLRRTVFHHLLPALTGRSATVPPEPAPPDAAPDAAPDTSPLPPPGTARLDVLGLGVDPFSLDRAVAAITDWIATGTPGYICLATVHGVIESRRDPELAAAYARASLVGTDGMPLVWWCRAAGLPAERVYGPDLTLAVCAASAAQGWRHFLLGATDETLAALTGNLQRRFPDLQIVGTLAPPFRPMTGAEEAEIVAAINAARPDIVWIGLGAPKQEKWMARHRGQVAAPMMIGVGAAFDFLAGTKRQAPPWMGRNGLEWLFRLCSEPRRLARRYLAGNALFVALTLARLVRGRG